MEQLSCRIISINAFHQTEEDGDEIFLKIGKKKVWPLTDRYFKVIEPSISLDLALELCDAGNIIELELWEYDSFLSQACLGRFSIKIDSKGGPFTTQIQRTKIYSNYSLTWDVVETKHLNRTKSTVGRGVQQ
jgi:hypothetical protein